MPPKKIIGKKPEVDSSQLPIHRSLACASHLTRPHTCSRPCLAAPASLLEVEQQPPALARCVPCHRVRERDSRVRVVVLLFVPSWHLSGAVGRGGRPGSGGTDVAPSDVVPCNAHVWPRGRLVRSFSFFLPDDCTDGSGHSAGLLPGAATTVCIARPCAKHSSCIPQKPSMHSPTAGKMTLQRWVGVRRSHHPQKGSRRRFRLLRTSPGKKVATNCHERAGPRGKVPAGARRVTHCLRQQCEVRIAAAVEADPRCRMRHAASPLTPPITKLATALAASRRMKILRFPLAMHVPRAPQWWSKSRVQTSQVRQ